jgi:hypothetical protein
MLPTVHVLFVVYKPYAEHTSDTAPGAVQGSDLQQYKDISASLWSLGIIMASINRRLKKRVMRADEPRDILF